ncbi:MAG TPA: AAA family ATPase [Mesorhizobium sp.]|jgi:uncharacterized protein YhaN|uniref:AAA family ATPase n=1 Tax=Mesorhizobium sp. TaxID=1871066 RepID=UPI002DDCE2E3|nr:AAA family ATPase [Mesorhizobium sp.]HEV2503674.1 AAA family ATPase [Mesorhizobium sp.]
MRLRRLDLLRYGKFTDKTIDFGPRPGTGSDLHIVFGLNEAGKSTALSGYLDLLFGIEERSRYNFLHEYGAMRVGAVLELGGTEYGFTRTKQRNNSLLDASQQPVSEVAITAHLAGLSREAYTTMFSLDDATLEAGGESILESRGDLGKLLFTASAGLGQASDVLDKLEAEADGIYRKQAQGTELALLKKRLAELKSQKETIDTLASTYETLEADRIDATQLHDGIVHDRAVVVARLDVIDRYSRARPMLADRQRKLTRLIALPDLPSPVRTWTASITDLIKDDASLRTRRAAQAEEHERLTARLDAIGVDDVVLDMSERIRALAESKVRHASAGFDLPSRRTELQIIDNSVADRLAALGRSSEPDPSALLLPAATVGVLRGMLEQRSGIATAARSARDEVAGAREALEGARQRVSEERAVPPSAQARVGAALSKARGSTHQADVRAARELVDAETIHWQAALARLAPWSGDAAALAGMTVPFAQQIVDWKRQASQLANVRAVVVERLAEHEANHASLTARLDALRASIDFADDTEAAAIRRARDEAWTTHRATLSAETADVFAGVLAQDDRVSAGRLANASDLADLRSTTRAVAEAEAGLLTLRRQREQLDNDATTVLTTIRALADDLLGGVTDLSLMQLIERIEHLLSARDEALAAWDQIKIATGKLERVTQAGEQLDRELAGALNSVGLTPLNTLEANMAISEQFLDRQRRLDAEHAEALKTVAAREDELARRQLKLASAERREEEWLADITDALQGTWLANGLSASAVGAVLDQLSELSKNLQERDALQLRIDKMEADRTRFLAEVIAVAADAKQPARDDAEQLAIDLADRLAHAEQARDARASLVADLTRIQDLSAKLDLEILEHDRLKNDVLAAFDVASLTQALERDEQLRERNDLRSTVAEIEERIAAELSAETFEQAQRLLEAVDFDALLVEKAESEQRLLQLDEARQQQLIRQTRAMDKLSEIGGDSAVARLDAQRRTTLLEIEDKAVRYVELKLGIMAAGHALRSYRERHRSGMMVRASEAFSLMTRGQYSGLTTQPAKSGDVLIAMQRDGQSKLANALSKGARFQLYLALRLAGYYEFAQLRPSVPFIADDIMETFDHVRSEEVFRLFGDMAKVGQVIYLTHHQHLCDIAKKVVPGATVHEL